MAIGEVTSTKTFTDELWAAIQDNLAAQLDHPFVKALGDGTLPRESFEFYIRQDARYLDEFAKTFAYAATRTTDHAEMTRFGELLIGTIEVEQALHREYAASFGVTPDEMKMTPLAPTNFAYTRHLLTIAATGPLAELLAAILPCAWIYAEVGLHFTGLGPIAPDHPYRNWLATYSSPEFVEVAEWLRARLDVRAPTLAPEERQRCHDAFVTSARYEYMFWDMAWRREAWPIK